jgi:hypothetical protein
MIRGCSVDFIYYNKIYICVLEGFTGMEKGYRAVMKFVTIDILAFLMGGYVFSIFFISLDPRYLLMVLFFYGFGITAFFAELFRNHFLFFPFLLVLALLIQVGSVVFYLLDKRFPKKKLFLIVLLSNIILSVFAAGVSAYAVAHWD